MDSPKKTSLSIRPSLLRKAKIAAAESETSAGSILEEALEMRFSPVAKEMAEERKQTGEDISSLVRRSWELYKELKNNKIIKIRTDEDVRKALQACQDIGPGGPGLSLYTDNPNQLEITMPDERDVDEDLSHEESRLVREFVDLVRSGERDQMLKVVELIGSGDQRIRILIDGLDESTANTSKDNHQKCVTCGEVISPTIDAIRVELAELLANSRSHTQTLNGIARTLSALSAQNEVPEVPSADPEDDNDEGLALKAKKARQRIRNAQKKRPAGSRRPA